MIVGSDNMTCLAYIRKLGGTKNRKLCQIAVQIWQLAQSLYINLETTFIPGVENIIPDHLSRIHQLHRTENKEWKLQKSLFELIENAWKPLKRDLFASSWSHQLPVYMTWQESHTLQNAFHHQWKNGDYAFPPFALIGRVLRKIQEDRCRVVLIAPDWPFQNWYTTLKAMSTRTITWDYSPTMLQDPHGNSHPLGTALKLTAWLVDGRS